MKLYEIKFNDYGIAHCVASSFAKAEKMFLASGYGGSEARIKSIIELQSSKEVLVSPAEGVKDHE